METRYKFLKKIENTQDFNLMLKMGIIPLSVLDKKVYYEYYLSQLTRNDKIHSITNTADEFRISESWVYKIIKYMESC